MSAPYPLVPLGEVLQLAIDAVPVDPSATYPIAGVYSFGRGLLAREPLAGTGTTYKVLHRLHANDFVLSQLKAWEGALARIPASFDGWYLSPQFATFRAISERLDVAYLDWYCKQSAVWQSLLARARGMGARRDSVSPTRFLTITIPLPPLAEQRRIVARIDALAGKIAEAQRLRAEAAAAAEAILDSAMNGIWEQPDGWLVAPMGSLVDLVSGQVDPRVEPFASLPHINGEAIESGTCRLLSYRLAREDSVISGKYHFPAGSILYSKIRPYLRKAVQVPVEGVCSADVYAFRQVAECIEPRFLMYSLIAAPFTNYANRLSGRTRMPKLNQKQLLEFYLSYPPFPEQRRIVEYLDGLQARVEAVKRLQAETAAELAALLPAVLARAFRGEL